MAKRSEAPSEGDRRGQPIQKRPRTRNLAAPYIISTPGLADTKYKGASDFPLLGPDELSYWTPKEAPRASKVPLHRYTPNFPHETVACFTGDAHRPTDASQDSSWWETELDSFPHERYVPSRDGSLLFRQRTESPVSYTHPPSPETKSWLPIHELYRTTRLFVGHRHIRDPHPLPQSHRYDAWFDPSHYPQLYNVLAPYFPYTPILHEIPPFSVKNERLSQLTIAYLDGYIERSILLYKYASDIARMFGAAPSELDPETRVDYIAKLRQSLTEPAREEVLHGCWVESWRVAQELQARANLIAYSLIDIAAMTTSIPLPHFPLRTDMIGAFFTLTDKRLHSEVLQLKRRGLPVWELIAGVAAQCTQPLDSPHQARVIIAGERKSPQNLFPGMKAPKRGGFARLVLQAMHRALLGNVDTDCFPSPTSGVVEISANVRSRLNREMSQFFGPAVWPNTPPAPTSKLAPNLLEDFKRIGSPHDESLYKAYERYGHLSLSAPPITPASRVEYFGCPPTVVDASMWVVPTNDQLRAAVKKWLDAGCPDSPSELHPDALYARQGLPDGPPQGFSVTTNERKYLRWSQGFALPIHLTPPSTGRPLFTKPVSTSPICPPSIAQTSPSSCSSTRIPISSPTQSNGIVPPEQMESPPSPPAAAPLSNDDPGHAPFRACQADVAKLVSPRTGLVPDDRHVSASGPQPFQWLGIPPRVIPQEQLSNNGSERSRQAQESCLSGREPNAGLAAPAPGGAHSSDEADVDAGPLLSSAVVDPAHLSAKLGSAEKTGCLVDADVFSISNVRTNSDYLLPHKADNLFVGFDFWHSDR